MLAEEFFTYIMSNIRNTVLYVGVTNNLHRRILEHKERRGSFFTKKYNIEKLIYYEVYTHPQEAIAREKQIKKYSRERKNKIISEYNPSWKDLFNELTPY